MAAVPAIMPRSAWPLDAAQTVVPGGCRSAAFRTSATALRAGYRGMVIRGPRLSGRPPRLSRPRSRPPLRKWPLETLPRISAHARRIPWKFFARSRRAAHTARCPCFSRKQNNVFFGDRRYCRRRNHRVDRHFAGVGSFGRFLPVHAFRVRAAVLFMVLRIVLMLLRVAMLLPVVFFMQTQRGVMLRTFMSRIRFRFGPIRCPAFFHFRGFFLGQLRDFRGVRLFGFGFGSLSFSRSPLLLRPLPRLLPLRLLPSLPLQKSRRPTARRRALLPAFLPAWLPRCPKPER